MSKLPGMWQPDKEIDEVTGEKTVDTNPVSAIFQALGAASVCWDPMDCTGVFMDDHACDVATGLQKFLEEHPLPQTAELLYEAWVVIANTSDWHRHDQYARQWIVAAKRWREKYHATLGAANGRQAEPRHETGQAPAREQIFDPEQIGESYGEEGLGEISREAADQECTPQVT